MTRAHPGHQRLYWVRDNIIADDFPDMDRALTDPDGLLAIGGDLSPERLLSAYARGIFPWNNDGQPVMWWSPDPRWVLFPRDLIISRSLRKTLNKDIFNVTFDKDFAGVIRMCAAPRKNSDNTWITHGILRNFTRLHQQGFAHSVECWQGDTLAGGLYGVAIGKIFFGESMFSRIADASKVALVHLCGLLDRLNFRLIDCQVYSKHLASLGAIPMARKNFAVILSSYCSAHTPRRWPASNHHE